MIRVRRQNDASRKLRFARVTRREILIALFVAGYVVFYLGIGQEKTEAASPATTFVVTNVNNSGPGSLRQAILDANANPGVDLITFNIAGPSLLIQPQLSLPSITDPVVIDGSTQPGFSGTPLIELNGPMAPGPGLFVNAPGSTIRSLVINGFDNGGIIIGPSGSGSHIEGCYIGTNVAGLLAVPNGGNGIAVTSSNSVIGGTTAAARNVISGNSSAGISVIVFCCSGQSGSISGNIIQGNYIGLKANGTAALGNQREGITITTDGPDAALIGTLVGGTAPGAGNVISGNRMDGIFISSFSTINTVVQGNLIGTNFNGMAAVSNDGDGVRIDLARNSLIGGSVPEARNVISGNGRNGSGAAGGNGVSLGRSINSSGNSLRGNFIGTNASGTGPLRNLENGVYVGGVNSTVGGTGSGDANVIAFNGQNGIQSTDPSVSSNSFRGNSIFSNGSFSTPGHEGIGIDLGAEGPTANDLGDVDSGPNNLQNFPTITAVTAGLNSTNVKGSLNSSANGVFNLDFYLNSACNLRGFGEGEHHIGSAMVTTDANGNANFDVTFSSSISSSEVLTATATDQTGNTSEFSPCAITTTAIGVSIGDVSAAEGNSGTTNFSFSVTLSAASSQTVAVNFSTGEGSATSFNDYVTTSGTVNIPAGQTSTTIVVQVNGDTEEETNETFFVNLTSATNANILDGQGTGTILNDDTVPQPLRLLLDESGPDGNQSAALDSVLFLRDPFLVINSNNRLNQLPDRNTRLIVFAENLQLTSGEPASAVVVNLIDSNSQSYDVAAEHVSSLSVPTLNLRQIIFRLPDGLPAGTCAIKLTAHSQISNTATIRIAP